MNMREPTDIERLFRTYYNDMFMLALRILHDREEARDAVSWVFVRVLEGEATLRQQKEKQYLLAAVRNRCLTMISHMAAEERFRRLCPMDNMLEETGGTQLDEEKRDRAIQDVIDTELTAATREILLLRFGHPPMTCREIAFQRDITPSAVYKHIQQALEKLRDRIGLSTIY